MLLLVLLVKSHHCTTGGVISVCAVDADGKVKKKAAGPLFQIHWWRVVLDEAQSIKNASTLMAHAAHALQVVTHALLFAASKTDLRLYKAYENTSNNCD